MFTQRSLDYSKVFILHTFSSDNSYATILNQKNEDGDEVPIYFMSQELQGSELKYQDVEKQYFLVSKELKHFRPDLLKVRKKVIFHHLMVRSLLVQKDTGERRRNLMTTLQEYDMEINPTKIMRGKGLCKLAIEAHGHKDKKEVSWVDLMDKEEGWENEEQMFKKDVLFILIATNSW